MKELSLQNSPLKSLVDDGDFEFLNKFKWYICLNNYARATVNRKRVFLHRLLLPEIEMVDHINGNGLDNRRINLRACTEKQNTSNRFKKPGLSIYKGVSFDVNSKRQKRWMARCQHAGKNITIGRFFTEEEAALAYNIKAIEFWGEFAVINDIENKRQIRFAPAEALLDTKPAAG